MAFLWGILSIIWIVITRHTPFEEQRIHLLLSLWIMALVLLVLAFFYKKRVVLNPFTRTITLERTFRRKKYFSFDEIDGVLLERSKEINRVMYWVYLKKRPLESFPISVAFIKDSKPLDSFKNTILLKMKQMIPTMQLGSIDIDVHPEHLSMYERTGDEYTLIVPRVARLAQGILFGSLVLVNAGLLFQVVYEKSNSLTPDDRLALLLVSIMTVLFFVFVLGRKVIFDTGHKTVTISFWRIPFRRRNISEFQGISAVPLYINYRYSTTQVVLRFLKGPLTIAGYNHPMRGKVLMAETLFLLTGQTSFFQEGIPIGLAHHTTDAKNPRVRDAHTP